MRGKYKIVFFIILILTTIFLVRGEEKSKFSKLLIIMPKRCVVCNIDRAVEFLKSKFSNLKIQKISEDEDLAKKLIEEFKIKLLPAYFLEKKNLVKKCTVCELKKMLKEGKDFYYIFPWFVGGSFFIGRKRIPNRLDVFYTPYSPLSLKLVELIKGLKEKLPSLEINFHFLVLKMKPKTFSEQYLLEESLRGVCVMNKFKEKFLDYLECRAKENNTTFWEHCLEKLEIWPKVIEKCALTKESQGLLKENVKLNEELEIITGPYILLENQQIFGITKDTTVNDLMKIIKKEVEN